MSRDKETEDMMNRMVEKTNGKIEQDTLFIKECFNKPENQVGYRLLETLLGNMPEVMITVKVLMHSAFRDGGIAALDIVARDMGIPDGFAGAAQRAKDEELSEDTVVKEDHGDNVVDLFPDKPDKVH